MNTYMKMQKGILENAESDIAGKKFFDYDL